MNTITTFLVAFALVGVVEVQCAGLQDGRSVVTLNTTQPEPQTDNNYMPFHKQFLEKIKSTNGEIPVIFWGDSLSEQWGGPGKLVFEEKYVPMGVSNFGIGGDRTQTLLWRLLDGEATDVLKTKVAVVMIGGNNAMDFATAQNIFLGIQKVVMTIRERMPKTKILLLGTLPGKDYLVAGTVLKDVNERAKTLADGDSIQFLNMYDKFLTENGTINWELYNPWDKIHLLHAGYELWSETMDEVLHKMLNYTAPAYSSAQSILNHTLSLSFVLSLTLALVYLNRSL